jgi:hypothetical protein
MYKNDKSEDMPAGRFRHIQGTRIFLGGPYGKG